jgi:hypothetical protein
MSNSSPVASDIEIAKQCVADTLQNHEESWDSNASRIAAHRARAQADLLAENEHLRFHLERMQASCRVGSASALTMAVNEAESLRTTVGELREIAAKASNEVVHGAGQLSIEKVKINGLRADLADAHERLATMTYKFGYVAAVLGFDPHAALPDIKTFCVAALRNKTQ